MDLREFRLYDFVDVLVQGEWRDGFVVSLRDSEVGVQVSSELARNLMWVSPSQLANFRSKTKANSPLARMIISYCDLGEQLQEQVAARDYDYSEEAFLQVFAGSLPYFSLFATLCEHASVLCSALLAFFKAGQRKTPASLNLVWHRVMPILIEVLQTNELSFGRRWDLFSSYVFTMSFADNPLPWVKSFKHTRMIVRQGFKPERKERVLILDLFSAYMKYCVETLRVEECLQVVLQILSVRQDFFKNVSRWKQVETLVRMTLEDLAFRSDNDAFPKIKSLIVNELWTSPYNLSAEYLLQWRILTAAVAENLISSMSGKLLHEHGLSLLMLSMNFPQRNWHHLLEKSARKDAGFVCLMDVPSHPHELKNPEKTLRALPQAEQVHFCEMYRLDLIVASGQLLPFIRFRRRVMMLLVQRIGGMRLPPSLWRILVDEFLYPLS